MNIAYEMIGELPQTDDEAQAAQDYLLWLVEQTEEDDLRQRAVDDYLDFALAFNMIEPFTIYDQPTGVFPMWVVVKDGNKQAKALYERHYSANHSKRRKKKPALFVGPGSKLVMLTPTCDALFIWRLSVLRDDGQWGLECTAFRNESSRLSSDMILEAEHLARVHFPYITRFFTYVNPRKLPGSNPGYCFKKAGYCKAGVSKKGKIILAKMNIPPAALRPWIAPT